MASVYPLAFAAEQMTDARWEIIDLTTPGVEAHDLELSLEQRAAIEDADVVVYLGRIGFQPHVERAVDESNGQVIDLSGDLFFKNEGITDPHIWLNPETFETVSRVLVQDVLCSADDPCDGADHATVKGFIEELDRLGLAYYNGLKDCRHTRLVVTHEAFGYLKEPYGISQFGLAGLTPEAEPSVDRLSEARGLIESGKAGAVFYEEHQEAKRIAESFAADAGVPALPLSTLESRPLEGDYFTVMEDNLESLREGLQCR